MHHAIQSNYSVQIILTAKMIVLLYSLLPLKNWVDEQIRLVARWLPCGTAPDWFPDTANSRPFNTILTPQSTSLCSGNTPGTHHLTNLNLKTFKVSSPGRKKPLQELAALLDFVSRMTFSLSRFLLQTLSRPRMFGEI